MTKVDYYEIKGCTLETRDGGSVLIAPAGTDPDLLTQRGFSQDADGRFSYPLAEGEALYISRCDQRKPIVFEAYTPPDSGFSFEPGDGLTALSLCLMAVRILFLCGITKLSDGMQLFGCGCGIFAWIFVIAARISNKENRHARTVLWIYLVLYALAFAVLAYLIASCAAGCDSCLGDCFSCGDVG